MRTFVADQEAVSVSEFLELALGLPLELWLGEENETDEERAARLDAARDILADNPGLYGRAVCAAVRAVEYSTPHLLAPPATVCPAAAVRRAAREQVAA
ncbi:hypothetical protein [Streptomyces sp. HB2AG]|uniref:hypothetical protein n=1 Tax=Streptomyces sp. HB2AG TaxID=2983400 RepID=UPI0022AA84B0|nr:hypothetical protein [Streptomyces sp. HB2AG]MCZ2525068.1 hypothetical protein [Streptomyces sp. HB2AG]